MNCLEIILILVFFSLLRALTCHPLLGVIGVFCTVKDVIQRRIVRNTWFRQGEICSLQSRDSSCAFIAVFVLGEPGSSSEEGFHDLVVLKGVPENMDNGKSLAWLKFAFKEFPKASMVFKTDIDTIVNTAVLLSTFSPLPTADFVYFGFANDFFVCGRSNHCPKGWTYMSGAFYGISARFSSCVQRWPSGLIGPEDLVVGRLLRGCSETLLLFPCNRPGQLCPFAHPVKSSQRFLALWTQRLNWKSVLDSVAVDLAASNKRRERENSIILGLV